MKYARLLLGLVLGISTPALAQGPLAESSPGPTIADLTDDVAAEVESMTKFTQVMVDMIFSFSELGFQEFETSRYITSILSDNGFEIEHGAAGMPTAWFARWGSGSPVIAFGSDIDGIPKASQKPGVAYHDPIVEGAPGHGEGHNSGQAVNVTAALALKKIMEREGIGGTLVLWPGVAEEQLGSKAYFVRDGYLEGIDAVIFTHVGSRLGVSYGRGGGTGLVSVEYSFEGQAAHGAGSPWRGRSALDAVELMNVGWNFRREHLRPLQRSHYVISDGGDQPNVVPSKAAVWYYFREMDYPEIKKNFDIGTKMAEAAAMMTDTEMSYRILGSAWPRNFNKIIAETMAKHIQDVGMPEWTEDDQALAKAVQRVMGSEERGLGLGDPPFELRPPPETRRSGGSDDIGDISWNVPTVTMGFPSNIPGLPGHHWSSAIAMATPIAHKGATAGAKVLAMTALDFFTNPNLVEESWKYYNEVSIKDEQYIPFISADDTPAIHLNQEIMQRFKPELSKNYFDPDRFSTYLEQLGITYPTLAPEGGR